MKRFSKYVKVLLYSYIGFFLALFVSKSLLEWLIFYPSSLIENLEIWRIITFPFTVNNIWEGLSLGFVFYFFVPQLERKLSSVSFLRLFVFSHLILVFCNILMFIISEINLALFGSVYFQLVVLISLAYLYPHERVMFFFISLKAWVLALIVGLLNVIPLISTNTDSINLQIINVLLTALIASIYIHAKSLKYDFMRSFFVPFNKVIKNYPVGDFFGFKFLKKKWKTYIFKKRSIEYQNMKVYVDELLGKISKNGLASLTKKERKFLTKASETFRNSNL